jgi:hypothetical protein
MSPLIYKAINDLGMSAGVISSPITVKQVQESVIGEQLLTGALRKVELRQTRLSEGYERLRSASVAAAEAMRSVKYGPDTMPAALKLSEPLTNLNHVIADGLSTEPQVIEFDAEAVTPNSDLEVPEGYEMTTELHPYQDYIGARWTDEQLLMEGLMAKIAAAPIYPQELIDRLSEMVADLTTQLEAARNELRAERQEWDSDDTPETCIRRHDEHNPILEVVVADYRYGFTVRNVEKDSHEWLMGVVSRQMQEIHDRAVHSTRQEIQLGMKKLLGIKS